MSNNQQIYGDGNKFGEGLFLTLLRTAEKRRRLATTGIHIQAQIGDHVTNSFDSSIQVIIRLANQILAHLGIYGDMEYMNLWRADLKADMNGSQVKFPFHCHILDCLQKNGTPAIGSYI